MSKAIDCVSLTIILFVLTFVWSTLVFSNWMVALIFTISITLICAVIIANIISSKSKPYSYERLELEFCIRGNGFVIDLFKSIIKNSEIENGSNYICLKNSIIIANYKFSKLTSVDMCNICNTALSNAKRCVYLLTKGVDRRAFQIAEIENIKIRLVKTKHVYKYLAKHNSLPSLKKVKNKPSLKFILEAILSRVNFKSYAFSGIILILTSFLTPLKIYYLVFGTLTLLLATLTLTPLGRGTITSNKAFYELEQQIKDEHKDNARHNDNLKKDNRD